VAFAVMHPRSRIIDYTRTRVHYRKRYTRRVSFNAELQPCFGGGMVFCEGGTTKCGSAKSRPFDLLALRFFFSCAVACSPPKRRKFLLWTAVSALVVRISP